MTIDTSVSEFGSALLAGVFVMIRLQAAHRPREPWFRDMAIDAGSFFLAYVVFEISLATLKAF